MAAIVSFKWDIQGTPEEIRAEENRIVKAFVNGNFADFLQLVCAGDARNLAAVTPEMELSFAEYKHTQNCLAAIDQFYFDQAVKQMHEAANAAIPNRELPVLKTVKGGGHNG